MIFIYIVLAWILVQLQAPVWVYILFIIGILLRTIVISRD
ncbi:unknown [Clostridium sp. CAG:510]|nr:unknown [Clostridium sp. CAG:510]